VGSGAGQIRSLRIVLFASVARPAVLVVVLVLLTATRILGVRVRTASTDDGVGMTSVMVIDVRVVDIIVGGVGWCGGRTACQKIYNSTTWI